MARGPISAAALRARDGQSPRDQYIERLQAAYRTPTGRTDPAERCRGAAEALGLARGRQRGWEQTANARRGPLIADRAYEEYCARLQAAWKTR